MGDEASARPGLAGEAKRLEETVFLLDRSHGPVMLNVALVKSGPPGPLLATKTGPPRSTFGCQKWTPMTKSGPSRTTFGCQKWTWGASFSCQKWTWGPVLVAQSGPGGQF